jgi:NAD(P)-dependent dehydrogenase (short-subunit alcohol dehydrogenase family)
MPFDAKSTTDDVLAGINLEGKTVVITGASGGLGAECARSMASVGASVILASRDFPKTQEKAKEIIELTGNPEVSAVALDLADQDSVRKAASEILEKVSSIDILINNAGIMACPPATTVQGLESQFGINHIGHFLFASALMPALLKPEKSRLVILSSGAHKMSNLHIDDLNWQEHEYQNWMVYAASKTANSLFAVEFNKRYASHGITANAVHPGLIITDLGRHLSPEDAAAILGGFAEDKDPSDYIKTIPSGAATSVWAATSPDLEGNGGNYLEDCGFASPASPDEPLNGYEAYALDSETASALWLKSEEIIGEKFAS